MVIRKTADLRIKKAELWGVNSGEQEASKLTSMSPLTFAGARKDDDGSMVSEVPKMEAAFRCGFKGQKLKGDVGDNLISTWKEQ